MIYKTNLHIVVETKTIILDPISICSHNVNIKNNDDMLIIPQSNLLLLNIL